MPPAKPSARWARPRVRIAEGPGHRRNTLDLADAAGYFQTVPDFEKLFVDLNLDDVTRVRPRGAVLPHPEALPAQQRPGRRPAGIDGQDEDAPLGGRDALDEEPVRRRARAAIYGWPKNVLHWAGIDESIADLHAAFPHHFAIVDGIVGMEGNGPIQGTPKHAGVLVAGSDPVAVDATCCRIMKIDPLQVRYLQLAMQRSPVAQLAEAHIVQTGEPIASVATPFELLPLFQGLRLRNA